MRGAPTSGDARGTPALAALLLAVFVVSVGYGVVLPVLPLLVERLAAEASPAAVARHTGLLTGAFALAPLLFAPLWGRLSDRLGRRVVIVTGLLGFGATLALSAIEVSLAFAYVGRFLNGAFAAAVVPAALAFVAERASGEAQRARGFALIGMAVITGALVGPMVGGLASQWWTTGTVVSAGGPFLLASVLALVAAAAVRRLVLSSRPTAGGEGPGHGPSHPPPRPSSRCWSSCRLRWPPASASSKSAWPCALASSP